jgi:hypothetical protein
MEKITVRLSTPMLYDRLHTLSIEYAVSTDILISLALKRFLDDVELIRDLRAGKTKIE